VNEHKLFSYTALTDCFNRAGVRSLRGTGGMFKLN